MHSKLGAAGSRIDFEEEMLFSRTQPQVASVTIFSKLRTYRFCFVLTFFHRQAEILPFHVPALTSFFSAHQVFIPPDKEFPRYRHLPGSPTLSPVDL